MPYKQYNNNQTTLTFPFQMDIPDHHIARVISFFVDGLDLTAFYDRYQSARGAAAFNPKMMLKMILFAYSRRVTSGAKIQTMAEENIPMKWLIGSPDLVPDARTINRFRSAEQTGDLIKFVYLQFRQFLLAAKLIDDEYIFIDGTKIVADANKYSFVWRRAIEHFEPLLDEKANALFEELVQSEETINVHTESSDLLERMNHIVAELDEKIDSLNQVIETEKITVGGSKNKRLRRKLKHYSHLLHNDLIPRKTRYREAHEVFGDRNSFSKTDHDATFMMMKEDPMNNGQTKPGYNLQIATHNQFVLYFNVNQRPTDQRTLIPFMHEFDLHFRNVVADAGYGSEQNYDYIVNEYQATPLVPFNMYLKEQSRRYRNDPSKRQNWRYEGVLDQYIDEHGVRFQRKSEYDRTDKQTGVVRHFIGYQAIPNDDPEQNQWCLTKSGNLRQISINPHWEAQKSTVRQDLYDEDLSIIYQTRKIEVEPVFGNLKRNLDFTRTSVRGLKPVTNELGIALMAGNLIKLTILIENHPELLKNLINWGSICCTLNPQLWPNCTKKALIQKNPTELSKKSLEVQSDYFVKTELCLGLSGIID